jgi:hypothetical protein
MPYCVPLSAAVHRAGQSGTLSPTAAQLRDTGSHTGTSGASEAGVKDKGGKSSGAFVPMTGFERKTGSDGGGGVGGLIGGLFSWGGGNSNSAAGADGSGAAAGPGGATELGSGPHTPSAGRGKGKGEDRAPLLAAPDVHQQYDHQGPNHLGVHPLAAQQGNHFGGGATEGFPAGPVGGGGVLPSAANSMFTLGEGDHDVTPSSPGAGGQQGGTGNTAGVGAGDGPSAWAIGMPRNPFIPLSGNESQPPQQQPAASPQLPTSTNPTS